MYELITNIVFIFWQKLHALRPIVDIMFHFEGTDMSTILNLYKQYVWEDNTHQARKDISRILSTPGFVTSYMIGQMEISRVKDKAERDLGPEFSLKDFHYEILREGEFPLEYLEEHITEYIACKKNPNKIGCNEIL